ncbi:TVP38/TMEM64 family protein [Acetonema longum]|uniref:TVP38/TMEM64 family membrane protein n=1 Tax=Acetonema longum DSM 6540 TaxID=1009370 RepID=F7NLC5_9FIRM|nr:TVP38/TMEM64 family protein [Acetonema longum]EGO63230.1 DedA family protein [Acetonema longum DSM 6540]
MNTRAARGLYALKLGLLLLAITACYYVPCINEFITTGTAFLHQKDFSGLKQFILSYGVWAPVTSIALMTLQSLVPLVPGLIITIANAWIFGWQYGSLYSWIGALIGAFLDFGLARWYGRPLVECTVSRRHLDMVDQFFKKYGILAVFITRLIPIIPFKVVSYGVGLTAISWCQYLIATGIGQTPAIVLYSVLSQDLARNYRLAAVVTVLLLAVGWGAYYGRERLAQIFFYNDKN